MKDNMLTSNGASDDLFSEAHKPLWKRWWDSASDAFKFSHINEAKKLHAEPEKLQQRADSWLAHFRETEAAPPNKWEAQVAKPEPPLHDELFDTLYKNKYTFGNYPKEHLARELEELKRHEAAKTA